MPPPHELAPLPAPLPANETATPERPPRSAPALTPILFVALFAFLLASFPARNSDIWAHLAAGRQLVQTGHWSASISLPDAAHPTWLYDLVSYAIYSVAGGLGLVLVKALLIVALGLLLLRLSRTGSGWWVPVLCTALALLAMGMRLLLQPTTVSYLFLALALWLTRPRERDGPLPAWLPSWPLALLFVIWANINGWFLVGLVVVALIWFGQAFDEVLRGEARRTVLLRRLVALCVLGALCLLNPAGISVFTPPPELGWFGTHSLTRSISSPFQRAYFTTFAQVPAALAYFPLLGLGVLSFVLALPRWSWQRFLPFVALAILSGTEARAIPFFAIVAGPVLAWNLHDFFARRPAAERARLPRRWRIASRGVEALLGLAFLACAWPGWLQGPPFEPRRWAIETPPSLIAGATTVQQWHDNGKLEPTARGLHLSPETAQVFAWFCPADQAVLNEQLMTAILKESDPSNDWSERMRAAGINHLIVSDSNTERLFPALARLFGEPERWPLLYVGGNLAVFGWRDPAATSDPFAGQTVNLDQLAFHPSPRETAPVQPPNPEPRHWWQAFWKPAPPRSIDRDEAQLHLLHAEVARRFAPLRHQIAWEATQAAALTAAAASWADGPGALLDAQLRLMLLRPTIPASIKSIEELPPPSRTALMVRQHSAMQQDDSPPALLYLAVRAARRAIAANPDDARAYLVLAESYLDLLSYTRERAWAGRLPEFIQLRRAQISWALNQAALLEPSLVAAQQKLTLLYRDLGYLDLSLNHARKHLALIRRAGPPPGADAAQFREQVAKSEASLQEMAQMLSDRQAEYAAESPKLRVADRAALALRKGLAGQARDVLLSSDVAAFGPEGMELELKLLLMTGRARDVLDWTAPEQQESLGATYYWLRVMAAAAIGDYESAYATCAELAPKNETFYRQRLTLIVGQIFADELTLGDTLPHLYGRATGRLEFQIRLASAVRMRRQEADVTVLRGLLALEQGDTEQAAAAFREALACWSDDPERGRLDFKSRTIAQDCLGWLTQR